MTTETAAAVAAYGFTLMKTTDTLSAVCCSVSAPLHYVLPLDHSSQPECADPPAVSKCWLLAAVERQTLTVSTKNVRPRITERAAADL